MGGARDLLPPDIRPVAWSLAGQFRTDTTEWGPTIQQSIPWQVNAAIIFADPEARASMIMSWDDVSYVVVTVHDDYTLHSWICQLNDDDEWEVAPLIIE